MVGPLGGGSTEVFRRRARREPAWFSAHEKTKANVVSVSHARLRSVPWNVQSNTFDSLSKSTLSRGIFPGIYLRVGGIRFVRDMPGVRSGDAELRLWNDLP
jgi:hypothetical protein